MRNNDLELGQMLFTSNTQILTAPDFIKDGLLLIAQAVKDKAGRKDNNFEGLLTDNSGEPNFENSIFAMRRYCWCDGDLHPDGCPPNFEHYPSGLAVSWYKHARRGVTINCYVTSSQWLDVVQESLKSLNLVGDKLPPSGTNEPTSD
jgi:hypothetical protein